MTQGGQLTGKMADVDALTAAVRLAPVGQQRDSQRPHRAAQSLSARGTTNAFPPFKYGAERVRRTPLGSIDVNDGGVDVRARLGP